MEFRSASFQSTDVEELEHGTLTVLEAARRAGVTQSAIIRWIRNGYLSATPSSTGWQIPAHTLDEAARSADEARGTGPVPRRTGPTLTPAPTPIRHTLEKRTVESASQPADIGEQIVSPLAELIRDQVDVIHDQAEVIGWLQAERSRLTAELSNLKAMAHLPSPDKGDRADTQDQARDADLYDEVLTLLWKDAGDPEEGGTDWGATGESPSSDSQGQQPSGDPFEPDFASNRTSNAHTAPEAWSHEPPDIDRAGEPHQVSGLRLEDYADPSWFFGNPYAADEGTDDSTQSRPVPVLQPIVSRRQADKNKRRASRDDGDLHRMIDETERKIAELWHKEEQLRNGPQTSDVANQQAMSSNRDRGTMWSRLWPLRR